jgi:hypothetical protein
MNRRVRSGPLKKIIGYPGWANIPGYEGNRAEHEVLECGHIISPVRDRNGEVVDAEKRRCRYCAAGELPNPAVNVELYKQWWHERWNRAK